MTRRGLAAGAAAGVLLLAGCGQSRPAEPTAHASASGVAVTATLLPGEGGRLRVTFAPEEPGFHLYSVDLPAQGIDGLGIPTVLAVRGGLAATGRPTADRATLLLRPAGLTTELPVYPDGPVTFTVPVRRTGSHQGEVVVSYGACSASRCLLPVSNEVLRLDLD
ncbi:hypothetical protein ABT095_18310 [Kitasatospora sp. NPDC002227]|uniref:hypothetical protein n=1 Tax=Kitasatospora sp. NPDC002227 TaxID=3154773 RepID=UPI003317A3E6